MQPIRTFIKRTLRQVYRLQELVSSVCRIVSWHDRWERAVPRFLGSYDASIFLLLWLRDSQNREFSSLWMDLFLREYCNVKAAGEVIDATRVRTLLRAITHTSTLSLTCYRVCPER